MIKLFGIVLIVIGLAVRYIINKRRFNRRSVTGLEQFSSYETAWTVRLLERIGKVLALLGILGGIGLLVIF